MFSTVSRSPTASRMPGQLDPTVAQAEQDFYSLTSGRAQELKDDPYHKSSMDYLQGVVSGQNTPFNDQVKNSILAQQAQGSADAEAASMAALRESLGASGQSIYDPGYQAAQREAASKRMGQNLDAMGQVNTMAALENQRAQQAGANQLASARGAQNAQINAMNVVAANQKAQKVAAVPNQPAQRQPMSSPVGAGSTSMTPPRGGLTDVQLQNRRLFNTIGNVGH